MILYLLIGLGGGFGLGVVAGCRWAIHTLPRTLARSDDEQVRYLLRRAAALRRAA